MDSSSSISNEPNWAWLPEGVLLLILTELFMLSDMVSFGSVCSRWHSVFKYRFQNVLFSRRLPMLLIPSPDNSDSTRNLYSIPCGGVHDLRLTVPFNSRCIGSCHGWLIFMDCVSFVVTLFNPFYFGYNKGTINLPPFRAARDYFGSVGEEPRTEGYGLNPEYYIAKAVLSADPGSSPNFTVMLCYGEFRELAYYKSGNETWNFVDEYPIVNDIIYSDGHFIVLNFDGELFTCDPESKSPELKFVGKAIDGHTARGLNTRRYIVAVNDGNTILQAVRWMEYIPGDGSLPFNRTLRFSVYKLRRECQLFDWLEVFDIGDAAMFVGDSCSCYVNASDFPGIIPNSIYFTDDYHNFPTVLRNPDQCVGPIDAGIFLIEDRTFRDHYKPCEEQKHLPPPIWIVPSI